MTVDDTRRQLAVHDGPTRGPLQTDLIGIALIAATDLGDGVVKDGDELLPFGTTV